MKIVERGVEELIPYENNPRINDKAVQGVANSIRDFGFRNPIIIDQNDVIICGHTRLKAAKKLHLGKVPCIVVDDLTDEQVRALRLADNKVSEKAEWDDDKLAQELEEILNIDMNDFGFLEKDLKADPEEKYTTKIDIVQYEPKGPKPEISDCVDISKYKVLVKEIDNSDSPDEEKELLKLLAARFIRFDFGKIANYYAHSDKDVQELFERSIAVQIDFNDAIQNGAVRLQKSLQEIVDEEL